MLAAHISPVIGQEVSVTKGNIRSSVMAHVHKKKADVNPSLYSGDSTYLEKSVSEKLGERAADIKADIIKARKKAAEERARKIAEALKKKEEAMKREAAKKALEKEQKAEKALDSTTVYVTEPDKKGDFDETDIRQSIWNYLCANGFSEAQTAGIMGNIQMESSFSTTDTNGTSGAFGLFQWLGGRKQNLMAFAGDKYRTAKAQIDFMLAELEGSESGAKQAILMTQTPEDAAMVWDRLFERSEGTTVARRQQYAKAFYNMYHKENKKNDKTA